MTSFVFSSIPPLKSHDQSCPMPKKYFSANPESSNRCLPKYEPTNFSNRRERWYTRRTSLAPIKPFIVHPAKQHEHHGTIIAARKWPKIILKVSSKSRKVKHCHSRIGGNLKWDFPISCTFSIRGGANELGTLSSAVSVNTTACAGRTNGRHFLRTIRLRHH